MLPLRIQRYLPIRGNIGFIEHRSVCIVACAGSVRFGVPRHQIVVHSSESGRTESLVIADAERLSGHGTSTPIGIEGHSHHFPARHVNCTVGGCLIASGILHHVGERIVSWRIDVELTGDLDPACHSTIMVICSADARKSAERGIAFLRGDVIHAIEDRRSGIVHHRFYTNLLPGESNDVGAVNVELVANVNIPLLFIRDLGELLPVPIHIGLNGIAIGQMHLHCGGKLRRAAKIVIARYRTFIHFNGLRLSCCPLRIQGNHLVGASNVKIAMQRVVLICGTGAITFGIPACEYPAAVFEFVLFQRSLIGTRARTHLLIRHGTSATVGIVMDDVRV